MGLSLDHTTYTLRPPSASQLSSNDLKQQNLDAHLHTIRSNCLNFANRFFDKPFTLIVDPSTRAGATGEHSSCDALVPSIVADYGIVEGVDSAAFEESSISGGWERLEWMTDDKIQKECDAAQARALSIIHNSDDSVLWFEGYGTDWIKGVGGTSIILSLVARYSMINLSSFDSEVDARCIHSNGPSARLVQNSG
jgi:Choline/Carnitine o-acyltransferase